MTMRLENQLLAVSSRLQQPRRKVLLCLAIIIALVGQVTAFRPQKTRRTMQKNSLQQDTTKTSSSSSSSSSRVNSSRLDSAATAKKFKNVEDMLQAFESEPVLLSFTAVNCGPCRLQKKELALVASAHKFKMLAIDTDKWPRVGTKFSVGKLPCLVVLSGGQERLRLEGLTKAEVLIEHVQTLLREQQQPVPVEL